MKTLASIELWTINRWLHWTGFRVYMTITTDIERADGGRMAVGLGWYGLHGSAGRKRIEGKA